MTHVAGLVLAAGQGTRMGQPKALVRDSAGVLWTSIAVRALRDGGCSDVTVVLGAAGTQASELLRSEEDHDQPATLVTADDWRAGVSASLRAGLRALRSRGDVDAAIVTLVDTPQLPPSAVARVLGGTGLGPETLRRAVYGGRAGHPVLIGRAHWDPLDATLAGDRGAGEYLRVHGAELLECADLWDGEDQDRP